MKRLLHKWFGMGSHHWRRPYKRGPDEYVMARGKPYKVCAWCGVIRVVKNRVKTKEVS